VKQIVCVALPAAFVAVTVKQWLPGGNTGLGTGGRQGIIGVCESQAQITCVAGPPPRENPALSDPPYVAPVVGEVMLIVGGATTVKLTV
jgi:hypothetical protein